MLAGHNQVNLTLNLGKAFDITYIRLVFHSPRPQSFAIYKRSSENGTWTPYQFYSATCRDSYGLPESQYAPRGEDTRALCTSEYSDISPLTGGNIAFSTLEGRPAAYFFDSSAEMQEFVSATDIRITLDRMNTFGDEYFGDAQVLRSYFYAIADFAVGARCKCNGHASVCTEAREGGRRGRECRCEHNTDGPDCQRCLPFYNDAPWRRATAQDAYECKACECNGFATRCFFDKDLYEQTGHGGHCLDCLGNRAGANCERCKDTFYEREDKVCINCNCDEKGSRSLQCNARGQCQCKPGVTGEKCDRCEANHYDFGPHGCTPCNCNEAGSADNSPNCDPYSGACACKEHVEGKRCAVCKPGFFNLDTENEFGCTPCFCYGHSSVCQSAPGYSKVTIESAFARGNEKWTAEDVTAQPIPSEYNSITQTIGVSAPSRDPVYFVAPDKFLGDQRASYNQDLSFHLRIGENGPSPTVQDVVLEGSGLSISQAIFGQGNKLPTVKDQEYTFRLHENQDYGWQPRLTARELMSLLSNLTAIKIRGTYTPEGVGFLDDVKLQAARRGAAGQSAQWIEMCTCPEGYVGQFCESCAPGFRHDPVHGGPFARCVPCNCHGHADICDADTGRCICQHNTAGDNCDRCAKGYYGNALQQTSNDCKPCPCPDGGPCFQLPDETVICLECPKGYAGPKCDLCSDGFYGDPTGRFGDVKLCQACDCNENVDPNAVGNCNRTSGECLKCIYNTGGFECESCLPGFYGDPLSQTKGDCKPCQCSPYGTNETKFGPLICDQFTGQCQCKPHVLGTNCDSCEPGYFNILSGEGCQACDCDPIGSVNHTCNVNTGQCVCREGITGLHCDQCLPYHYGFSTDGCKPCDCDGIGSTNLQCDPSGQCPCYENVEGRRCDRCKENKYDRQHGCRDCPACYNLVQDAVSAHRSKLNELKRVLKDIANNPTTTDDSDFESRLAEVQRNVDKLHEDAKTGAGSEDTSLLQKIEDFRKQLEAVASSTTQVKKWTKQAAIATEQGEKNVTMAEKTIERIQSNLKNTMEYLQTDGKAALQKALDRSNEFGQRSAQMSDIVRKARTKAEQQEDEVEKIKKIAEEAKNVSSKAFTLANSALNQQQNTSNELRKLGGDIVQLGQKLEGIKGYATMTSARVNATHEDALSVYSDIFALILPDINVPKIKEDANIAKVEAERMKTDAEELVSSHTELLKDLNIQMEQSEGLLQAGEQQRDKATELLSQVDAAYAKATEAVETGEKIFLEAQETYATLQKFDKQVQESRAQAPKALKQKPNITQLITEAKIKTNDARLALAGAQTNSQNARDSAQDAQVKYADQASKEADEIRQGAQETKEKAGKLRDEADLLAERVVETGRNVGQLEQQATRDEDLTSSAKKNVGQAKSDVSDAAKQVQKALEEVEAIIKELNEYSDTNDDSQDLNNLEERLEAAKQEFDRANLDNRIESLTSAKQAQTQWMKSYQEDLERLVAEVDNIGEISEALPSNCFKQLALEPDP
ncbi:laminin subunit gamma-1 isoform X1 [Frankliniella occidentalis]|uniref:Laminin subunit gamma-1 isoform X1 n=1 Tax=Frankliniella occidentalis TaxID=133901 RepID=A0A9C6WYH4_FRAOC|nr:laminin subunit gamma-1 isoform X1 [Frankliniella occidentalis]